MTAWTKARLDECCEIVSGATPRTSVASFWDGDVPWATPKDLASLRGRIIKDTPRKLTPAGLASCGARMLPAGSVLFSSRAPIGYVAINSVPMATNQGFKSLVPHGDLVDAGYLYWWLWTNRSYLEGLGNGATFKEVSKAVMARVELPLPSLAEQLRIADVLDRARSLRDKRQDALGRFDLLARSLFLDGFGDPIANPKGWPRARIGEIGDVITGNTPPRARPEYFGTAIEWIKSDNLSTRAYYATRSAEGLSLAGKRVARIAPANAILVTCIAGSSDSIGNAAMTDREVAFNQQINALVPGDSDPRFIYAQLIVGKKLIQQAATAAMKGMVSKSRFEAIELVMPPLDLQREFGRRIAAVETQRAKRQQSLAWLDEFFFALQQRAFAGEL